MICRHCRNPLPGGGRHPKYCVYCGKRLGLLTPFRMLPLLFAVALVAVAVPLLTLHPNGKEASWEVSMLADAPEGSLGIGGIWGSSPSDVFAIAATDIWHYDGSTWEKWNLVTDGSEEWLEDVYMGGLSAIWGTSPSDVFAVGGICVQPSDGNPCSWNGFVLHFDGETWAKMDVGTANRLSDIWGSSPSDVFAVGAGVILHYDGTSWSPVTSGTTTNLSGVWGSSSSDVFAVGANGKILHYDGSGWSVMDSATPSLNYLSDVWGSSSSDVFAVGTAGVVLHYDGASWTLMESTTTYQLYGVWGSSSSDVFAVGDSGFTQDEVSGIVLHYNGRNWTQMKVEVGLLSCVWGNATNDVFAGGYGIVHYS